MLLTAAILSSLSLTSSFVPQLDSFKRIQAPKAKIAVIDTGVDFTNNPNLIADTENVCEVSSETGLYQCHPSQGLDLLFSTHDLTEHTLQDNELLEYIQSQSLLNQGLLDATEFATKYPPEHVDNLLNAWLSNSHGTIVANIIASENPEAHFLNLRIIPDQSAHEPRIQPDLSITEEERNAKVLTMPNVEQEQELNQLLLAHAVAHVRTYINAALYMKQHGVEVANISAGFSIENFVERIIFDSGYETEAGLVGKCSEFFVNVIEQGMQEVAAIAPEILFVIAAGNDGLSTKHIYPANIEADNFLVVGAVDKEDKLASYSNWGPKVQIAARGNAHEVGRLGLKIDQALDGTSFAAPRVSRVAAKMKDINPRLQAADIKHIIVSLAQKIPDLDGKVSSGGVLNEDICLTAAGFSKVYSIKHAIQEAQKVDANEPPHCSI